MSCTRIDHCTFVLSSYLGVASYLMRKKKKGLQTLFNWQIGQICPFHWLLESLERFDLSIIHFFYDSGDTDSVIPVTSTRYSVNALKLPMVGPWRAWYDDGQVI